MIILTNTIASANKQPLSNSHNSVIFIHHNLRYGVKAKKSVKLSESLNMQVGQLVYSLFYASCLASILLKN